MNEKLNKIKELLSSMLVDDEAKFGSVATEAGVLYWDGDKELEVGDKVYTADENGENKVEAEDGDYKQEDGTVIKVADHIVSEIVEPEAEDDPQPEPEAQEPETEETALSKFQKEVEKFEESYEEKEQKIREAIARTGVIDFWIAEAGDDYAVVSMWVPDIETSKYFKYLVTWGEDGEATATLEGEVVSAYVPVEVKEEPEVQVPVVEETKMEDEPEPETKEPEKEEEKRDLEKEIDELKALVEDLKAKIDALSEEPAAKTPAEEFEAIKDDTKMTKLEQYGRALRK